jgi:hypothetical protein
MQFATYTFSRTAGVDSIQPDQDIWEITSTNGGSAPSTLPGKDPIYLTDGKSEKISTGFSNCSVSIYPAAGVAFTCVNNKVVRIQIGQCVVVPPDPPQPEKTTMSMPTTGVGTMTPGGAVTPAAPANPWD